MDPKMLVLDLDGTALTREGRVSEADIAAAAALARGGVHVTIATGRLFGGTVDAARALGVRGSVAVMNGTELVDADTGEVVTASYVHDMHRATLRAMLDGFGLAPILFANDGIRHDRRGAHIRDYLAIWTPEVTHHDDLPHDAWDTERLAAVCATGDHDAVHAAAARIRAELPDLRPTVFTTHAGHGFLELRTDGTDKATALVQLAAERGLDPSQVVAVGDWHNDVTMLRAAGHGFAMGDASDDAIAAADAILDARRGGGGAVVEVARRVWGL